MRACPYLCVSVLFLPLAGCDFRPEAGKGADIRDKSERIRAIWREQAEALAADNAAVAARANEKTDASDPNWGTIRGQVVYGGNQLPAPVPLKVDKDLQCCMPDGKPVFSQKWVVNPQNKGVRWIVVFLRPAEGQKLEIHPSLEKPKDPEIVLDQPNCVFTPHVLVMRKGQKLTAKNPDQVPHNVLITGINFSDNKNLPVGQSYTWDSLQADYRPSKLGCGQHPWMEGYLWVLAHPYFTVTDEDGKFEIKLAPTGTQNVVIWHETGLVTERAGKPVEVKAGQVADLGKIEIKPKN